MMNLVNPFSFLIPVQLQADAHGNKITADTRTVETVETVEKVTYNLFMRSDQRAKNKSFSDYRIGKLA